MRFHFHTAVQLHRIFSVAVTDGTVKLRDFAAIGIIMPMLIIITLLYKVYNRFTSMGMSAEPPCKYYQFCESTIFILFGCWISFSVYGFTYDVFICAHDELRCWVEEVILLPLETTCNPPYKICWHLRDFVTGLPINEQIVNAIYESRKIVIVFSKHFMDSKFCQLELEHAMYRQLKSRTRCLLPITLSSELVPPILKNNFTYLEITGKEEVASKLLKLLGKL